MSAKATLGQVPADTVKRFDALRAGPEGSSFEFTSEVVTTQQLVRYAGASEDYNRIHYDLPYAEAAGLGGVIAHGMLTMAFMARAAGAWVGPRGLVQHIQARFTSPVRPGDTVEVSCRATACSREDLRGHLSCELLAQVSGRRVAEGMAVMLVLLDDAE